MALERRFCMALTRRFCMAWLRLEAPVAEGMPAVRLLPSASCMGPNRTKAACWFEGLVVASACQALGDGWGGGLVAGNPHVCPIWGTRPPATRRGVGAKS